ncbi:MAG: extracellular solute-binding protein, partial [Lachnospiraceae bacterium]|nr:extracellular solute-binding protein [Lachnospiraceae bacterium]
MVTIKDIARSAGVSQGTVSNVINKTGKVSAEKIKLVEDAISRLGYIPNVQASLLRQGGSHTVAVIIPTLKENTCLDFYCALRSAIESFGYEVLIYTSEDTATIEEAILEKVRIANILAVVTISTLSEKCCKIYSSLPCPVIYIERKPEQLRAEDAFYGFDFPALKNDWNAVLSGAGWQRVAVFTSPYHFLHNLDIKAYLDACAREQGIALSYYCSDINFAFSTAFDIVQAQPAFDAIIASGTIRSSSISTVLSLCRIDRHPALLAIDSASVYSPGSFSVYEMDFSELGFVIAKALVAYSSDKTALRQTNIFQPKGFSYQFPSIKKGASDSISLLTLDNPSTSALRKLLPIFEAVSGITVHLECASYTDLHAQLDTLKSSCCYDLIRMDVADFQPLGKELYLPLSEVLDINTLPQALYGGIYHQYSVIDKIPYAIPFDPSVQLFLYRRDLFDNALICRAYYEEYKETLSVPKTLEQYIRIAKFFSRSEHPDSPTQFGATAAYGSDATCASDFLPHYMGYETPPQRDPELFPLNSAKMIEVMRQYKELQNYTCKQEWWRDSLYQFTARNAATTIVYSNYASDIINPRFSKVIGQVGAAIIPGGHPLLGGGVIGVSRFSRKIKACEQFFTWYYSNDITATLIHLGTTPPLANTCGVFVNTTMYPWSEAAKESMLLGTRGTTVPDPKYTIRNYEFAIGTAVQKLILDDIPPEHAALIAQTLY